MPKPLFIVVDGAPSIQVASRTLTRCDQPQDDLHRRALAAIDDLTRG